MREIAKCPRCGEEPFILVDLFDKHGKSPKGYLCCGAEFSTLDGWNKYAAAMELARATKTLEDVIQPLNSGKIKMSAALPAIRLAMEDQKACEARVLEVFK